MPRGLCAPGDVITVSMALRASTAAGDIQGAPLSAALESRIDR